MAQRTIFSSAKLFDGVNETQDGVTIAVEDGKIAAVGKDIPTQDGDQHIDLAGKTVIPGMTAGHYHAEYGGLRLADVGKFYLGTQYPPAYLAATAVQNLGWALDSGITNVVGAGCSFDIDAALKMAINDGRMRGPRMRACGTHINTTANENEPNWWLPAPAREDGLQLVGGELFADGPEGMRKAVRHQLRRGAEVMKIFPSGGHGIDFPEDRRSMASDEMAAVIRTAHDRGAIVRGHITTKSAMMEAINLGIDIVDHGDSIDEEVIEAMVKHGTFYVPSMLFLRKLLPSDTDGDLARATQLAPVKRSFEHLQKMLKLVNQAGVTIVPGDDFGLEFMMHGPGLYAEELEVYVRDCGIAARDVLTWATANGGKMMGREDLGQIKAGFAADLVVLKANPLDDITLLQDVSNIELIMKDGVIDKNTLPASAPAPAAREAARVAA